MSSKRAYRLSRSTSIIAGLFGLGLAAGCSSASEGTSAAASEDAALSAVTPHTVRNACDQTKGVGKFHAFCLAQVVTDLPRGYTPSFGAAPELTVTADHKTTDVAYGPSDFQSAYAIPAGGEGVTVAIIDAQDDPNAESDLAVFRTPSTGCPPAPRPTAASRRSPMTEPRTSPARTPAGARRSRSTSTR